MLDAKKPLGVLAVYAGLAPAGPNAGRGFSLLRARFLGLRLCPAGFDVFPPRKCFVIRLYSTGDVFVWPQRIPVPVKVNRNLAGGRSRSRKKITLCSSQTWRISPMVLSPASEARSMPKISAPIESR